ncbi:DUF1917 domain-containing protein [Aspergillus nidulans FGSC A4]|uniref:DUF1917-domain-containing protein n=1 Tax=Emericella nidulans (strain FGSC A4 / ATCC 38163 / CBS 112.46 / NRRL 194 / M139) TaxID=227321 RepID=C8VIV7_EMENI|nr:hypothetical protein [Aspergillus nidulans FGSC A4]CBF83560.1 TPA: conserved hypothetical protein [Aspergillus nidulans FGSC A4]
MPKSMTLSPEDIFSDESSFYGSEEETTQMERVAATYNPETYWIRIHPHLLTTIQARNQEVNRQPSRSAEEKNKMAYSPMDIDTDTSYLPRNEPGPNESSTDFLKRVTPSTTREEDVGPWIYVHTDQLARHKEDQAAFITKGLEALDEFVDQERKLREENDQKKGSAIALSRKVKPLQRELERHVFEIARETNCITGKWMMFITPDQIDSYWQAVADATMKGLLGICAKVATLSGSDERNKARLMAVYTRDYDDIADVKRVLRKLVELKLVKRGERPIYYKRDALTYLNIKSGNRYGMKVTALSSVDVLGGKV